jgi:hypothetical protein
VSAPSTSPPNARYRRWPLYWFARLEAALERGNLAQAADAQEHLKQLGLRVEFLPPWTGQEVRHVK